MICIARVHVWHRQILTWTTTKAARAVRLVEQDNVFMIQVSNVLPVSMRGRRFVTVAGVALPFPGRSHADSTYTVAKVRLSGSAESRIRVCLTAPASSNLASLWCPGHGT